MRASKFFAVVIVVFLTGRKQARNGKAFSPFFLLAYPCFLYLLFTMSCATSGNISKP